MTIIPDPLYDPPAIHRSELRDHARWTELGGHRIINEALRAGRIFDTLDDLIAAGYDPDTRRRP